MSELRKIEVPLVSSVVVKKNPKRVFELANQAETGVYVLNRSKVVGVMLTPEQYAALLGANHIEVPRVEPKKVIDDPDQMDLFDLDEDAEHEKEHT